MFGGAMLAATMLAAATFVFAHFSLSGDGTSAVADGQLTSKMVHSFIASNSTQNEDQFILQVLYQYMSTVTAKLVMPTLTRL